MGAGSAVTQDAYGHLQRLSGPTTLTAAADGVTTAGTIAVETSGAGTGATVTIPSGSAPNDLRGRFTVTGAGTPAAGVIAVVNFSQPYANVPTVLVNVANATPANIAAAAVSVTVDGFSVYAGSAVSVGANTVSYVVIP
jgi:hypothetical protein